MQHERDLSRTAKRRKKMTFSCDAVGVPVTRFQVAKPHPGHRKIMRASKENFSETFLVLGDHGGLRTNHDPLTFLERQEMVHEEFPDMNIQVGRLRDHPFSTERWCNWLDQLVAEKYGDRPAVMIGSRDSFLEVYRQFGKHQTMYVEPLADISGTKLRKAIVHSPGMSWREKIIHHEETRPAVAYSTVDIAIVNDIRQELLGIRKHWFDGLWSLPGGFVDPEKDENDMGSAKRERGEELPDIVTSESYQQLGDRIRVDDPRYRKSKDRIYSSLFVTRHCGGILTPGDDAKGAQWFRRDELKSMFVPWHQPLVERIIKRWDDMHK